MEQLYLVDVSVLVKGMREPSVSFFARVRPEVGTVVTVPFRGKTRLALVVGVKSARQAKGEIKNASFSLKKVSMAEGARVFTPSCVKAIFSLADFYATSPGEILQSLFPGKLLPHIEELVHATETKASEKNHREVSFVQAPLNARLETYIKEAEKAFASERSLFILVPTRERARLLSEALSSMFDDKCVIELSSRFSAKRLVTLWNSVAEAKEPMVVVATQAFLTLPMSRDNTALFILEGESEAYRGLTRPFIDARRALAAISLEEGIDLLIGDVYVSSESVYLYGDSKHIKKELGLVSAVDAAISIIDMKPEEVEVEPAAKSERPRFSLFSDELLMSLKKTVERGGRSFLFVARRGLFPSTACSDCRELVECPECSAGLVLHESDKKERLFLCHRCGFSSRANIVCKNCCSWRLTPLGIGVDRVFEKLKEEFEHVFAVSQDRTKSPAQARKQVEEFLETPGAILIGTDMAIEPLLYRTLSEPIELVGVVSIDARFSIPHYAIEEDVLHTLLALQSIAKERFIVQTRARDHRLFDVLLKGELTDFREETAHARRRFGYPPFQTLLSLSYNGTINRVERTKKLVEQAFADDEGVQFTTLPYRKSKKGRIEAAHIVRLQKTLADTPELKGVIRALPPEVQVKVNPEELW